ncbi:MAG: hypothetical protein J6Y25_06205 [Elusimicrobiaceae bacterium]|nr:hypothetical protein [Elusimicrobiaceae bacterium]
MKKAVTFLVVAVMMAIGSQGFAQSVHGLSTRQLADAVGHKVVNGVIIGAQELAEEILREGSKTDIIYSITTQDFAFKSTRLIPKGKHHYEYQTSGLEYHPYLGLDGYILIHKSTWDKIQSQYMPYGVALLMGTKRILKERFYTYIYRGSRTNVRTIIDHTHVKVNGTQYTLIKLPVLENGWSGAE